MATHANPVRSGHEELRRGSFGANALVIMAKAPLPGTVKTRLVPPLSHEEAAELYRCLLLDILDGLRFFAGADLFVAFTPAVSAPVFQELVPPGFVCFPQRDGDLGHRMHSVFVDLSDGGYKSIVLIGSDLPVFPIRFLQEAFAMLERSRRDLVLGPSRDGGYYLIAMGRSIPEIFKGIPWGEENVLAVTLQKISSLGLKAYLLPTWFDIDIPEDLRYLESVTDQFAACSQSKTLAFLKCRVSALLKEL
ncbi:MAG: TIGR04282 family arsenosugar biosynthesis glycosyltransferase [Deltaproteobacteria bacterium]|nr:TIGR04282 family arsenosugar biosynthesis glycosyltransferase [Deltaproteobacteria bacterium]